MNILLAKAEIAREFIQRQCELDELAYQLLILETGCQFLEKIIQPGPHITEADVRGYREYLGSCGFWDWYVYRFHTMEVEVAERWATKEPLVTIQSIEYKRDRFTQEVQGIRIHDRHLASFDLWLKQLGERRWQVTQKATNNTTEHVH